MVAGRDLIFSAESTIQRSPRVASVRRMEARERSRGALVVQVPRVYHKLRGKDKEGLTDCFPAVSQRFFVF